MQKVDSKMCRWTDKITPEWIGIYTAVVSGLSFLVGYALGVLL